MRLAVSLFLRTFSRGLYRYPEQACWSDSGHNSSAPVPQHPLESGLAKKEAALKGVFRETPTRPGGVLIRVPECLEPLARGGIDLRPRSA